MHMFKKNLEPKFNLISINCLSIFRGKKISKKVNTRKIRYSFPMPEKKFFF